jgi:hypothetical protein
MPVIGHEAPIQDPDRRPPMRLDEHALKCQEIIILLKQAQPSVGPVEHVINQSPRTIASQAQHYNSLHDESAYVKVRVTFSLTHL